MMLLLLVVAVALSIVSGRGTPLLAILYVVSSACWLEAQQKQQLEDEVSSSAMGSIVFMPFARSPNKMELN